MSNLATAPALYRATPQSTRRRQQRGELARLGVATFTADWTLYDDDIRQALASFGKAGVPMYLVYKPGAPEAPQVLPELLTVETMIEALRNAAGVAPQASVAQPQTDAGREKGPAERRST